MRDLPDEVTIQTQRLATRIIARRADRNGSVLSLRGNDLETIEVGLGRNRREVLDLLKRRGLLLRAKDSI
jgi:hypothetical protein